MMGVVTHGVIRPTRLGVTGRSFVLLGLGLCLVALVAAGLGAQPPGSHGLLIDTEATRYIGCALAAAVPFVLAVWLVRTRAVAGWAVPGILALGLVARLLVLVAPPIQSTDIYRYVWDGRVQAAGISPYRYVPADPALSFLRDPGDGPSSIFENINRADVAPTIYPPAAQALFALVGITSPSIWTMKAVMMGFDVVACGAALLLLRAARLPLALVLVWAWHPLVIWQFANEGHIDAASGAFAGLAMLAAVRSRHGLAGAALGVAVLLKLLPAALFPALWRRWDLWTPLVAGAVILAGYGWYSGAGLRVFGYLPGYAAEEGSKGFYLVQVLGVSGVLPGWAAAGYAVLALVVLGGVAAWVALRAPLPDDVAVRARVIARDALVLSAALLAMVSPHYSWYFAMLILPAVLVPAWSALWATLAAPLFYFHHDLVVVLPAIPLLALDVYLARRGVQPELLVEGRL